MTLDQLIPGQSGVITAIGGQGALRRRLLDMGLTPNTHVKVRKVAPMGDPIELYLRSYVLTIRKDDAAKIQVEEVESDETASAGRQSKLRQDDTGQLSDGLQPTRRQFSWRHRRKERGHHTKA